MTVPSTRSRSRSPARVLPGFFSAVEDDVDELITLKDLPEMVIRLPVVDNCATIQAIIGGCGSMDLVEGPGRGPLRSVVECREARFFLCLRRLPARYRTPGTGTTSMSFTRAMVSFLIALAFATSASADAGAGGVVLNERGPDKKTIIEPDRSSVAYSEVWEPGRMTDPTWAMACGKSPANLPGDGS
jgi:hypothetical protein